MEMQVEIRIKKYGIFNPPVLASAMIRVFPSLDHSSGACPTHRRQWADFLAALTALPCRYDKTARTETRCHLLLKLRQVTTQTSASRGYVLLQHKDG